MQLQEINKQKDWDKLVIECSGHPLQLWGWGEVKATEGNWQAHRLWLSNHGGAQILIRRLPRPFSKLAYIPRGPILIQEKSRQLVLDTLTQWAKEQGCIELKIETDKPLAKILPHNEPDYKTQDKSSQLDRFEIPIGWRQSDNHILISKTVQLDLAKSENDLLNDMVKKTRQYIHKSSRENISVRKVKNEKDIQDCLEVYKLTARRAGFALHSDDYYLNIAKLMEDSVQIYLAENNGEILAFLWNIVTPQISFELYGGVNDEGQKLRANYVLKWHVIQACKNLHVKYYDMNGLLNDGVSNFKLGFSGGYETYLEPTLDRPLSTLYKVWENLLPAGKKVVRAIKKSN